MKFHHGQSVERLRAKLSLDPYSKKLSKADWTNPDVVTIAGAFVAQSSTTSQADASRTSGDESMSLYCAPDSDVRQFDRIRTSRGVYQIDGIPAADVNPFTGWQPVMETRLSRTVG